MFSSNPTREVLPGIARAAIAFAVFAAILMLVALGGACSIADPRMSACVSGTAPLDAVLAEVIAADNAVDIKRVLENYSDTVVWLPPDGEALVGKAAIRPRYERLFRDFRPAIELDIIETVEAGTLGVVRGRTHGHLQPVRTGNAVILDDKFLAVLRCQNRRWLISHLSWSPRDAGQ